MELPTKGGGLGVLMAPLFAVAAIPAAVADTVPSAELRPGALETMVVLGTGTQTSIFENPASITALEAHELRRTPTTSVSSGTGSS